MLTFTLSLQSGLLVSMVRALITELYPDATFAAASTTGGMGTRVLDVQLAQSGRWLRLISARPPGEMVWPAIADGCSAVLTLDSSDTDFRHGIGTLMDGGPTFVAADLLRWMATQSGGRGQKDQEAPDGFVRLTDRESEVLQLVAEGLTNADIARTLDISPNTVRTHLHALAVKLDGSSRTKILAKARALGIPAASGRRGERGITESLTA